MPLTEKQIDDIVHYKIIVDAYEDFKVYMGWAIYMEENLSFPFEAEYLVRKAKGESEWKKVGIIGIETDSSDFNGGNYYLSAVLEDVNMVIPVEVNDLKNIKADEHTLNTLQVWSHKDKYC